MEDQLGIVYEDDGVHHTNTPQHETQMVCQTETSVTASSCSPKSTAAAAAAAVVVENIVSVSDDNTLCESNGKKETDDGTIGLKEEGGDETLASTAAAALAEKEYSVVVSGNKNKDIQRMAMAMPRHEEEENQIHVVGEVVESHVQTPCSTEEYLPSTSTASITAVTSNTGAGENNFNHPNNTHFVDRSGQNMDNCSNNPAESDGTTTMASKSVSHRLLGGGGAEHATQPSTNHPSTASSHRLPQHPSSQQYQQPLSGPNSALVTEHNPQGHDFDGKLFLGGISWDTTEDSLSAHFSQYGQLTDIVLMKDKYTGQPRGFGFITYSDNDAIERVLKDAHQLDGRSIEVKRAVPRDKAPGPLRAKTIGGQQSSYGGGGGGGGYNNQSGGGGGGSYDGGQMSGFESKKVFVGGIPTSVSTEEFREYFGAFGEISDAIVMVDRDTQRSRGFGFVTFFEEQAIAGVLNKTHELHNKRVEIKRAEPKASSRGRGGGRGDGGGGRGNMGGRGGGGAYGYGYAGGNSTQGGYGGQMGQSGGYGYGSAAGGQPNYGAVSAGGYGGAMTGGYGAATSYSGYGDVATGGYYPPQASYGQPPLWQGYAGGYGAPYDQTGAQQQGQQQQAYGASTEGTEHVGGGHSVGQGYPTNGDYATEYSQGSAGEHTGGQQQQQAGYGSYRQANTRSDRYRPY